MRLFFLHGQTDICTSKTVESCSVYLVGHYNHPRISNRRTQAGILLLCAYLVMFNLSIPCALSADTGMEWIQHAIPEPV